MKNIYTVSILTAFMLSTPVIAEEVSNEVKVKLTKKFDAAKSIAKATAISGAVAAHNKQTPPELSGMTQEKWKAASLLDKTVRSLSKNACADALKSAQKDDPSITEAFVSVSDGTKACFITKPSNWSHKGKPKHDQPMAGSDWTGPVEVDASSGLKQVQIAVPILIDGKPAGSLVVGYQISKL